jgi:tetratricopeptide (TPR) repeat protein
MRTDNKVYEVLKMLRPYDIDIKKARVGSLFDGGYVLADNRTSDQVVLSYGLGGEISFDAAMAMEGHQCYMFDHTVPGLPEQHQNFHFYREGVGGVTEPEKSFFTVQDHLKRFSISGDRLILKMDVEGYEWEVMSRISDDVLSRFEQIAIEVHDFHRLAEPEFLDKVLASLERINRQFTLFHVHANNNNPMSLVSGFTLYNLLELSYIKTNIVNRKPSRTLYPTELDNPNEQDRDDYILSAFPFWPHGLSDEEYDDHARKCKLKNDTIVGSARSYLDAVKHIENSDLVQAESCLRKSLKIRPSLGAAALSLVNVLNMKAISLYNGGRFGEAVTALREALTIVPTHPDLLRNLEAAQTAEATALIR